MVILDWLYEYWMPIQGYEGLYEVSNWGRVRSLNYNHTGEIKILKTTKDNNGYLVVSLHKGVGKRKETEKRFYVHRLVGEHFIENVNDYPVINHKDENTSNSVVWNLEWCSVGYNNTYGTSKSKCYKKIGAFIDNVLIKEYSRASDVENDGFNRRRIYKVIDKPNNKAYGFMWKHI